MIAIVVSGTFGKALAWIVVVPALSPVTGTMALTPPRGIAIVAGTVATVGSAELRLTVSPAAGAGDDRISEGRPCLVVLTVRLGGKKISEAPT